MSLYHLYSHGLLWHWLLTLGEQPRKGFTSEPHFFLERVREARTDLDERKGHCVFSQQGVTEAYEFQQGGTWGLSSTPRPPQVNSASLKQTLKRLAHLSNTTQPFCNGMFFWLYILLGTFLNGQGRKCACCWDTFCSTNCFLALLVIFSSV